MKIVALLVLASMISSSLMFSQLPGVGTCKGMREGQPCQMSEMADILDGTCQAVGGGDLMKVLTCKRNVEERPMEHNGY